ncbi:Uncharacterised protein [Zhongshania aliphaticivorans]|uniref:Uncharacterized protein n=1 Tax=Zhongshania aliphaticivorans TaxID=1470434 RepID=A0A5S9PRY1_9GAMM|nr:Uncharacterised protein [Zhongshania aliphaticivorans]CAA0107065.1 Uncharacterised protein [Zhongshania aliphaticivorans]
MLEVFLAGLFLQIDRSWQASAEKIHVAGVDCSGQLFPGRFLGWFSIIARVNHCYTAEAFARCNMSSSNSRSLSSPDLASKMCMSRRSLYMLFESFETYTLKAYSRYSPGDG